MTSSFHSIDEKLGLREDWRFDLVALDHLADISDKLKTEFLSAKPFAHIVFDGLLLPNRLQDAVASFPDTTWPGWTDVSHEHQYLKQSCSKIERIPVLLRNLIHELNSAPFLDWMSAVTGIPLLLPDPHLYGGGLHVSGPGGTLTPHTDFHVVKGLSLYRRLNLLLYLNPQWEPGDGGELELWDKKSDRIVKTIAPKLGTCVMFKTDNISMHGFTNPVARQNRQSVAMYYYTAEEADEFSGDGATYWRSHTIAHDPGSWGRLQVQRGLLFGSRVCSGLSWRLSAMADRTRR